MPIGAGALSVMPASAARLLVGPWYQQAGGVWVVDSEYEMDRLHERLMVKGEPFGWDTETTGVNPKKENAARGVGRIVCWSAAFFDDKLGQHPLTGLPLARRVFVKNWGEAVEKRWLYKFEDWFSSEDYLKIGANIFSFDRHVLYNHGIELFGIVFDNVRASRLHDPSSWAHSLKDQGQALGYEIREYNELFQRPKILKNGKQGKEMVLVPLTEVVKDPLWLDQLIDYASLDAKMSLECWPVKAAQLQERRWQGEKTLLDFYNERLNPYMYVLSGAERAGWDLDSQWCFEQSKIAEYDAGKLERKLVEWTGVRMNFNSPKQIAHYLYGRTPQQVVKANPALIPGRGFAIPPVSRPKKIKPGQEPPPPTDDIALSYLSTHVKSQRDQVGLKSLLEWRSVMKTKQYLDKLPGIVDVRGQNRIHCQLSPDAETGRLTARNPPLQQIPKPGKDPVADRYCVREAFTCPPGYGLICADYSQLEMRILAHFLKVLFNDTKLADDLETGDLHAATALRTFGRDEVEIPEEAPVDIVVAHKWEELDPFTAHDPKWMNTMAGMVRDTPLKAVKKFFPSFRDKGKIVNFCVSEDTLALTPRGWKRHDQLRPGMKVLGRTGWVKINKVHRYEDTELVDMWGFHVTRQHRWWAERRTTLGGGPRRYFEEFVQTDQFTAEHRARLSTPQQLEDRSGLTPSEAALIGWLLTDGHVNKQACSVFQKNPLFIPVLDELFKAYPHSRYVRPSGIVQWRLKQSVAEKYRHICDNISEDFVLSLGPEQRRRFVEAGWHADGVTKRRKPWGKYLAREPERSRFDQNAGPTADAFRLAMFLEGYYVSQSEEVSRTGKRFLHMTMSSPYKTRQRKPLSSVGSGMSWCLETEDSTFTIRRGDRIAITGNSVNYGKTAFGLGRDLRDENDDPIGDEAAQDILDAYFRAYPGILSYKKWSISYARKRGYARTLLGRYRPLIHIWQEIDRIRRHAERQAQNTPIQGSAMDVAMMAQLKTNTHPAPQLMDSGFYDDELARMEVTHIMQIHDELVFRCPWAHIEEARARVKLLMENPLEKALSVPLPVEAGIGVTWREAH